MAETNIEEFKDWMRHNTNLLEGTIALYGRTIKHFLKEHKEVNLDSINIYVSNTFRNKNKFYAKYAFKQYLTFIKRPKLYDKVVKVKTMPRKKLGKYLPERMIKKIISNINHDLYRDFAILQFSTGARAREIITLKEENIDLDFKEDVIRLRFEGKGGKERPSFLSKEYTQILEKYLRGKVGYIFLPKHVELLDKPDFEKIINNERTYYYNKLQDSIKEIGIERYGTHDFRRNVVEILKRKGTPIDKIQKVLGHNSITTTMRYFDENPEDVEDVIIDHQKNIADNG